VRNCKFRGRADLNHHREHVRQKIVEYLRRLVSLGVAGFKIDGAQYIWPTDLAAIYEQVKPAPEVDNSLDAVVDDTLFIYHELSALNVTSGDDYRALGAVTDSKFFKKTGEDSTVRQGCPERADKKLPRIIKNTRQAAPTKPFTFSTLAERKLERRQIPPLLMCSVRSAKVERGRFCGGSLSCSQLSPAISSFFFAISCFNWRLTVMHRTILLIKANFVFRKLTANVLKKTKGSELRDLKQDVLHWSSRDVLYVDNHETQRGVDVSDPKQDVVSYQDRRNHVLANILMLAVPQGIPRVMSSYALNVAVQPYVPPKKLGPPSDHAFNTRPVLMSKDYACYNGWICEHRYQYLASSSYY
ncbi:unnamed protein product, partial [Ixodes pacificus]